MTLVFDEEKRNAIGRLKLRVEAFVDVSLDSITRRSSLGAELNFEALRPRAEEIVRTAGQIDLALMDKVPLDTIWQALAAFDRISSRVEHIQKFSLHDAQGRDLTAMRDQLLQAFVEETKKFHSSLTPILACLNTERLATDWTSIGDDARDKLTTIRPALTEMDGALQRIREAERIAQLSLEKLGIAQHAQHFASQATEHTQAARRWLVASAAALTITFGAVGANLVHVLRTPSAEGIGHINVIVAKLVIFAALGSLTVWCARLYRAHRHNYVVNRHRQNALSSLETFAAATGDATTRNAVLLQATQSIFAPQHSGYSASESDAPANMQLVELIRTVGEPQK